MQDAPTRKVGWQPGSCCSKIGEGEGIKNTSESLNGYSQRFPSVRCCSEAVFTFFFGIKQHHFKDKF